MFIILRTVVVTNREQQENRYELIILTDTNELFNRY